MYYSGQPSHITLFRNKTFTKIKIVFLYLTITKMTLEEQTKCTPMLQCLTGSAEYLKAHFWDVWNTFQILVQILWILHVHSCRFFFPQVPWNLLSFCCKIQYFMVARHLTFSALSSCPFTCLHLFFPSVFFPISNSFDYSKYSVCSQWVQTPRGQAPEDEFQLPVKDWEHDD